MQNISSENKQTVLKTTKQGFALKFVFLVHYYSTYRMNENNQTYTTGDVLNTLINLH